MYSVKPEGTQGLIDSLKELRCPFCGFQAESWGGLISHIQKRHPLNGECPICAKQFSKLSTHLVNKRDCKLHQVLYLLYNAKGRHGRNGSDENEEIKKEIFG